MSLLSYQINSFCSNSNNKLQNNFLSFSLHNKNPYHPSTHIIPTLTNNRLFVIPFFFSLILFQSSKTLKSKRAFTQITFNLFITRIVLIYTSFKTPFAFTSSFYQHHTNHNLHLPNNTTFAKQAPSNTIQIP